MRRYLVLCLLLAPAVADARAPNVVFLLADDLGWSDVGFNGRKDWKTPHVDTLAAQGTIFSRWYVSSVVCAPSRAALMTGKVGIHNGVSGNNDDLPADQVTVADLLRKQGYKTAMFGKWHHGRVRPGAKTFRHPLDLGFDEFVGFVNAREAWEHFPKKLHHGRVQKDVKEGSYAPTLFADHAIDFMTKNRETPFFLYVPFIEPHLHVEAPAEDVKEYAGKFEEADPKNPIRATYAAMITRLDKEIGRILASIDALKLADDTIVIFTSDHGATFEVGNKGASAFHDSNRPFRGHKRTLFEGGIRVPACVRWPGRVPAGKTSPEIVHMTDVLPTLLAAAGKPEAAGKVDGVNMLDVWQGKAKAPARTLYWEWRMEGYQHFAAMRGDMKLVQVGTQPVELYDVIKDPGERRSRGAEFPKLRDELRKGLADWIATETEESKWGKKTPK